ncbi:MAG: LptE family protein [Ignavibacteriales bacterium]|nr:MAG: LptE family protein [Ignavibacteriales bacterium]
MKFSTGKELKIVKTSKKAGLKDFRILFLCLYITYIIVNFEACFSYSFTGAAVPPHLETIAIPIADDRSGSGEPGLRELLTDQLITKFISDNTLQVAERSTANCVLECVITSLSDAPAIVSAGENVSQRRITINVQVSFKDLVKRKNVFDKSFSNYGDYSGNVADRSGAIADAIDKITEDILLDTVSGW